MRTSAKQRIGGYAGLVVGLAIQFAWAQGANAQAAQLPPVLPAEESDTAVLPAAGPHRLITLGSFGGSGGAVVEGGDERLKVVGSVPMAGNAAIAINSDASKIYVGETYWSRGNRGDRVDLLSVYDGRTLNLEKEIPIPGRLHIVAKLGQMGLSDDGKLAYIYSLVPASQVHVVDLATDKVATSVDIGGCAMVYPYGPRSFATLCADGTVGAATLPQAGEPTVTFSPKFFDADTDPVFEQALVDHTTGDAIFVSYSGKVYPAKLGGTKPVVDKPWSLTAAAGMPITGTGVQELAWRPGGAQFMTMHRATGRMFILMHPGNFWTQKDAGTEVWVYDVANRKLIRRIPLAKPAKSVMITQDDKPLLFTFGGEGQDGDLIAYDPATGKKLRERSLRTSLVLVPGL